MMMPSELDPHAQRLAAAAVARDPEAIAAAREALPEKLDKFDRMNLHNVTMVKIYELAELSKLSQEQYVSQVRFYTDCLNGILKVSVK